MRIRIVSHLLANTIEGHPDWITGWQSGYVDADHNIVVSTAVGKWPDTVFTILHEIGHVFIDYLLLNLYHSKLFHACWEVISCLLTPNFTIPLKSRLSNIKVAIKKGR